MNKIEVYTDELISANLDVHETEHKKPCCEVIVPGDNIEMVMGAAVIKILNMTTENIVVDKDQCIARADPSIIDRNTCVNRSYRVGERLTEKEQFELNKVLDEFASSFAKDKMDLGVANVEMDIELTEDRIIHYRPYRLSQSERETVRGMVSELLEAGVIEESSSPYASPIVLVKKKNNEVRMCVDYRALNKITKKERYPLPIIQDQLDRFAGRKVFTTLDLASGYHQIPINERSRQYTAFVTPDGHYQYKRVSFGLCNAPSVFQKTMCKILAPVLHKFVEVYIDDIIILGDDVDEGLRNLKTVLKLISQAGLKIRLEKCGFLMSSIEYLGHEIGNGEMRPSRKKIEAVTQFKTPTNVHEVRQFIGLASYFRKFIKNFARVAQPITKLTKNAVSWHWDKPQEDAFISLKQVLTEEPVLSLYNSTLETQVHTDASKLGLGGILVQKQIDGVWKPVAYVSRQTSEVEQRYHSFELEALAVVFSVQKFRVYLSGIKFTVVTDCNALRAVWVKRDMSPRIGRWWLMLQDYDFDVEYRPGTQMGHVDALSRNPIEVNRIVEEDYIDAIQASDASTQELILNLKRETEANKGKNRGLSKEFQLIGERLCRVVGEELIPVLPRVARRHILKMYHDENGHVGSEKCLDALKEKYWFPRMTQTVEKYVKGCIPCQFAKKPSGRQPGLLHPIPKSTIPFHTLHVDHLGPFCRDGGKTYVLAIVDASTKYIWLEAVANANTQGTLNALERLIKTFGYPTRIISDQGSAFTSRKFEGFCETHGIKHVLNAVASPRANGQVERFNRTILNSLVAVVGDDQKGWVKHLPKVQLGLNSTVCKGTGKTPLELVCGLRPRLSGDLVGPTVKPDLPVLRTKAAAMMERNAECMKRKFDKKRKDAHQYQIGDLVMVERKLLKRGITSGKLVDRYAGPYKVIAALPHDRYTVRSFAKGRRSYQNTIAVDHMKPWRDQALSESDEENEILI